MSEEERPLPAWGDLACSVFFLGVAFTALTSLLDVRSADPLWWLVVQVLVSAAEVVGLVTWLAALYVRRRGARPA